MNRYTGYDEQADVIFNNINGGVHAWAGAPDVWSVLGTDPNSQILLASNKDISASQEIWNIFRRYTHPDPKPVNLTSNDDIRGHGLIYDDEFLVYPNPFVDQFQIRAENVVQARLFDISGKLVLVERVSGDDYPIHEESLNPGMYILEITDNLGRKGIKKLVKH